MSGLEPLVALGVACNILQLVEVGRQTIDLIQAVYRGGSPDKTLDENAAILEKISDEVKTCQRPARCPKHEQQLLVVANKCSAAARDLREEIYFLVGNAKQGSLASTLKVVARTSWRRRRLHRLKEDLDRAEKLMQSGLLARIWLSTNAAELNLNELRVDLRSFIDEWNKGHQDTKDLVSRESLKIRDHISCASTGTEEAIGKVNQTLDSLALDANTQVSQARCERLLQSLKYPGFNERRNQVSEAHENTFRWVFAGDGDEFNNYESGSAIDPDGRDAEASESREEKHSPQEEFPVVKWDSFSNWLSSTDTIYWISGKPGSGKTTLVNYVLGHPQTQKSLDIWCPGSLIVSHFFWRPGTAMQQNIKGLLCSLLHQLLQSSSTALKYVLSSVPRSNTKDSDTDWSVGELQSLCLQILPSYDRSVCIFLDGLDEVDPKDGVTRLLNLVEQLSHSGNTKVCLASRPEPLLQRRLSAYSRLRLQDLTIGDLTLYAQDHVKFPEGYVAGEDDDPIHSLVHRAEGVFLWLVLATKSINMGLEYGDTTATIQERIDRLPGDLVDLYKDMYKRACEDDPQAHRRTAALFFKLLLMYQSPKFGSFYGPFNVLTLTLASTSIVDQVLDAVDEPVNLVSEDVMLQNCRETERIVNIYCFGLVELGADLDGEFDEEEAAQVSWYGHKYDRLLPFAGRKFLRFIHRTAHDFLVDTAEGQEILSLDKSSEVSLPFRIIKAYLASAQFFVSAGHVSRYAYASAEVHLSILRDLRQVHGGTDAWVPADWRQMLRHCERLGNSGKLFAGTPRRARLCTGVDFLKVVVQICPDEQILSRVKDGNLSKDTKSEILLNACSGYGGWYDPVWSRDSFVEQAIRMLLREGADPNWQGALFSTASWVGPFAQLETPFSEYLGSTLMLAYDGRLPLTDLVSVPETLNIFISHGANLDDMVNLFFELKHDTPPGLKEAVWSLEFFQLVELLEDKADSFVFVSFPAYSVLDTLLYVIRQKHPQPGEESEFGEMLSSLDRICTDWCSSERGHVFGRLFGHERPGEAEWYETTGEHQKRIADELMDHLREWSWLSPETRDKTLPGDSRRAEALVSLCQQAPKTLNTNGFESVWERFEELGICVRMDETCEVHSIEDWVKERAAIDLAPSCLAVE